MNMSESGKRRFWGWGVEGAGPNREQQETMGRTVAEGVVDARGEAFGHPGLHVTCGAAMPGPVGPNPSLTIAAWAGHVAEGIAAQMA